MMCGTQLEKKGLTIDRATIAGAGLVHLSACMMDCGLRSDISVV